MHSYMMLLTPAAMLPAVSASNCAAASLATGASDLCKAFLTAQTTVQAAVAAPIVAAATTLASLWSRFKRALQRLFGARPHVDATSTSTTDVLASIATETSAAVDVADDTCTAHLAMEATLTQEVEAEPEPVTALVALRAVAGHAVARDDPLVVAVEAALITRHAALGFVPRDTVLELISCLLATRDDRTAVVGEDTVLLVDGVLRTLARHHFDVAATYVDLAPRWLRCLRFVKRQQKHRALVEELEDFKRQLREVRRTHTALAARWGVECQASDEG